MKLNWKGRFKDKSQLEKGDLPENAVQFREPDSFLTLNIVACFFIIPVFILLGIAIYMKRELGLLEGTANYWDLRGFILAFIMILPHEFLHALAFPKEAEVQVWYSPKSLMAFVFSSYPVSKKRFIFLSLLPNMIFGFIPLIVWIFIPETYWFTDTLVSFAFLSLVMGGGDYMNVFNASWQMPRAAYTQSSGFHSFWFMPEKMKENF
ncbi:DUF3267 domain-containing protein [Natronospora cellulosivora (SeqCode)]